jgi:signal recognition particle receptor subunit beta
MAGMAMATIDILNKLIMCKIVYYGTGLGGKTANLKYIYSQLSPTVRGDFISLATETERTLFFDFLALDLGKVQNFQVKFALYTVPGQTEYIASRKLILNGADGIIFVADSDAMRRKDNIESMNDMQQNMKEYKMNLDSMAWVLQYNKRDLNTAMNVGMMEDDLNPRGVPSFEAIANEGLGVFASLRQCTKLVLNRLQ